MTQWYLITPGKNQELEVVLDWLLERADRFVMIYPAGPKPSDPDDDPVGYFGGYDEFRTLKEVYIQPRRGTRHWIEFHGPMTEESKALFRRSRLDEDCADFLHLEQYHLYAGEEWLLMVDDQTAFLLPSLSVLRDQDISLLESRGVCPSNWRKLEGPDQLEKSDEELLAEEGQYEKMLPELIESLERAFRAKGLKSISDKQK